MRFVGMGFLIACQLLAGVAQAATLTSVNGQVLVNQGNGYKLAVGDMDLKPGDSVLANPKGSAQIVYSDCATVEVKPGDVVYVGEAPPCAVGAEGAAGLGGAGLSSGLIVGGLAVAAGVGIVAGVSGGSDKPASP